MTPKGVRLLRAIVLFAQAFHVGDFDELRALQGKTAQRPHQDHAPGWNRERRRQGRDIRCHSLCAA